MSIIGKLLKYGVTFDSIECSRQALPVLDFVRWRKPRWVTRAKSKEFVLSKRHEYNTEETEWLRRTENHYRTQMKAIWQLIKLVPDQSLPNDLKKKADKEKIAKASWKEMEERMKDWNEQVAMIREAEQSKMNQQRQNKLLGWLNQEQLISEQFSEETLKRLQREKEAGFITPENVERKLMESLETTADYEFALDKEGVRVINFDESTEKKQG